MEEKIVIDKELIKVYNEHYFKKYPKRKKVPIKKPIPPSLNYFIAMQRMAQNSLKQTYKEFSIWLANYYNIADLNLNKAQINYTFFFGDHRRRDVDNLMLTPKLINDGFVEAGVLIDDNGENLSLVFNSFKYDKENPRVEMLIRSVDDE